MGAKVLTSLTCSLQDSTDLNESQEHAIVSSLVISVDILNLHLHSDFLSSKIINFESILVWLV